LKDYYVLHDPQKFLTITSYNNEHSKLSDLCRASDGASGMEDFETAYEKAKLVKAYYITVSELKTERSPLSTPSAKYQIMIEEEVKPVVIEEAKPEFISPQFKHEQFEGLGGLGELMNVKERLYQNEFEKQALSYENKQLRDKNETLVKENDDYEQENQKLEEANLKLIEELQPYKEKDPSNFKIAGFDVTGLLGAAIERGAKNLIIKHPNSAKSILGINDAQLNGFIGELKGEPQERDFKIDHSEPTNVGFDEDDSKDTPHLQVSKQIFEWLKQIPTVHLQEIAEILTYCQQDLNKTKEILELVKTNMNPSK